MHTSCNFLSAILYHPSLSAFSIYHPDSGWHVTSSDQGLSFPEERAWERGCGNSWSFEFETNENSWSFGFETNENSWSFEFEINENSCMVLRV